MLPFSVGRIIHASACPSIVKTLWRKSRMILQASCEINFNANSTSGCDNPRTSVGTQTHLSVPVQRRSEGVPVPTPCPVPMPCTVPVPCTLPTLDKSRVPRPHSIMMVVLPESESASRRRGDQDAAEAGNILPSKWSKAHGLLLHAGPDPVDNGIDSSAILARGV